MTTANFLQCDECGGVFLAMGNGPRASKNGCLTHLRANRKDAATEKHMPQVTLQKGRMVVQVGSVPHPMTPEHYIEWIFIESTYGGVYCNLTPGDEPAASFPYAPEEVVSVYAFCNLHGLWKAAEPVLPVSFDTNDVACSAEFSAGCVNPLEG